MGLLKNMRLSRKLLLIGLIFSIPIAWLLWLTVQDLRKILVQTDIEVEGVAYLRPLVRLVDALRNHESLSHSSLSGKTEVESSRATVEQTVDDLVRQLVAVDRRTG